MYEIKFNIFIFYSIRSPQGNNPHGGRHVTITVRETKTEKVSGSPVGSVSPTSQMHCNYTKLYCLNKYLYLI